MIIASLSNDAIPASSTSLDYQISDQRSGIKINSEEKIRSIYQGKVNYRKNIIWIMLVIIFLIKNFINKIAVNQILYI